MELVHFRSFFVHLPNRMALIYFLNIYMIYGIYLYKRIQLILNAVTAFHLSWYVISTSVNFTNITSKQQINSEFHCLIATNAKIEYCLIIIKCLLIENFDLKNLLSHLLYLVTFIPNTPIKFLCDLTFRISFYDDCRSTDCQKIPSQK